MHIQNGFMLAGAGLLAQLVDHPSQRSESCVNATCGQAVVDTLPRNMLHTLIAGWGLEETELAKHINEAILGASQEEAVAHLRWYNSAGEAGQKVAWPARPNHSPYDFENMLGALSGFIMKPDKPAGGVEERFEYLPPGYLAEGRAFCFSYNNPEYARLRDHLERLYSTSFWDGKTVKWDSLDTARGKTDIVAGLIGRVLLHALREIYVCWDLVSCGDRIIPANAFLPKSYDNMLESLKQITNIWGSVCFTFTPIPFKPSDYWIHI